MSKRYNHRMPDLIEDTLLWYNGEVWVILSDKMARYVMAVNTFGKPKYLAVCSLCYDVEPMVTDKVSRIPGLLSAHDKEWGIMHTRDHWYRMRDVSPMGNLTCMNDERKHADDTLVESQRNNFQGDYEYYYEHGKNTHYFLVYESPTGAWHSSCRCGWRGSRCYTSRGDAAESYSWHLDTLPGSIEEYCVRCDTPVSYTNVSPGYYAFCPWHNEDLFHFEVTSVITPSERQRCASCGATWTPGDTDWHRYYCDTLREDTKEVR
jgi:hypothetical protein